MSVVVGSGGRPDLPAPLDTRAAAPFRCSHVRDPLFSFPAASCVLLTVVGVLAGANALGPLLRRARRARISAAITLTGRPPQDRRQDGIQAQRQFDRHAIAQILAQAAGNVRAQAAIAAAFDERFEQRPRSGCSVWAAAFDAIDELRPAGFGHLGHAVIVWRAVTISNSVASALR